MKILNITKKTNIAADVKIADTALSRLVGLLKHSSLSPHQGLIITQCRSIHMFFMRFSIDVIFVDKYDKVIGLVKNIKPWRMSPYYIRSSYVVELFPGTIDKSKTEKGDVLSCRES